MRAVLELPSLDSLPSREAAGGIAGIASGMAGLDARILRSDPRIPALYASGVRYQQDGSVRWRDIYATLQAGRGDCDDLVPWRIAELWLAGVPARPFAFDQGDGLYHLVVQLGNGRTEDPSLVLGM